MNAVLAGLSIHWPGTHSRVLWRSIVKEKGNLLSGLLLDKDPAPCMRRVVCMSHLCDLQVTGLKCEADRPNEMCVIHVVHILGEAPVERPRGKGLSIIPQLLEVDYCCGQAYGDKGLERWVDRSAELAEAFEQKILNSKGAFQLVLPRSPFNVCFWWVPQQLRPYKPDVASAPDRAFLSKVIPSFLLPLKLPNNV